MYLPESMRSLPQWICCAAKRPVHTDGTPVKWSNQESWMTADEVQKNGRHFGFVLTAEDPFVVIDLDKAIDASGEVATWAAEVLQKFRGTYTEISQSGHGLHIFLRADDTHYGTRKSKVACDGGNIEVYSRDRFIQVTGFEYYMNAHDEVRNMQEAFDEFVQLRLMASPCHSEPVECDVPLATRQRAAMKLAAEARPSISGQGGHDALFELARDIVRGCALTNEDDAMRALRFYNEFSCDPPWSENELRHKVKQASTSKTPTLGSYLQAIPRFLRETKSTEESVDDATIDDATDDSEPEWHDGFGSPGGLLQEMLHSAMRSTNIPQVEMALPCALSVFSAMVGGKYEDQFGFATNLYFIVLGPTASGKTSNATPFLAMCEQLGVRNGFRLQASTAGSVSGVWRALETSPSLTLVLDEFHQMISQSGQRGPHAGIVDLWKTLFNEQTSHVADMYADAEKNRTVHHANFSFVGTTNPDDFWSTASSGLISDGFLNRCMLLEIRDPFKQSQKRAMFGLPPEATQKLQSIVSRPRRALGCPPPLAIQWNDDAIAAMSQYNSAVRNRHASEAEDRRSIWARSSEKAMRLTRLLAVSANCDRPVATAKMVAWAVQFVNYSNRLLVSRLPRVGTTSFVRDQDKILRLLAKAKGGKMLTSQVRNRLPALSDERDRLSKVIRELQMRGLVAVSVDIHSRTRTPYETISVTESGRLSIRQAV